jgi:ferredoxin, 2Fe-2S
VDLKNPLTAISLMVTFEGETYHLETYPNEYRNLMILIYDKLSLEDFGDCLGMGKRGTCLIEIEPGIHLNSFNRNEDTTLLKAGYDKGLRLACQILIDEYISGITVKVIMP